MKTLIVGGAYLFIGLIAWVFAPILLVASPSLFLLFLVWAVFAAIKAYPKSFGFYDFSHRSGEMHLSMARSATLIVSAVTLIWFLYAMYLSHSGKSEAILPQFIEDAHFYLWEIGEAISPLF